MNTEDCYHFYVTLTLDTRSIIPYSKVPLTSCLMFCRIMNKHNISNRCYNYYNLMIWDRMELGPVVLCAWDNFSGILSGCKPDMIHQLISHSISQSFMEGMSEWMSEWMGESAGWSVKCIQKWSVKGNQGVLLFSTHNDYSNFCEQPVLRHSSNESIFYTMPVS